MSYINMIVDVAPNATAYDEDYPTRSTELYNHTLHELLVDMDDGGSWYLNDKCPSSSEWASYRETACAVIEDVFDYADLAITTHRTPGTPALSKPAHSSLPGPIVFIYDIFNEAYTKLYTEAYKFMWFIYYMWMTEEDPLLLKEKLQELLIAWPLMDTTIDLQTESGQTIRMYPSWKSVDLDL